MDNNATTTNATSTSNPISITGLSTTTHTIKVIGIDASGNKQSGSTDVTWTIQDIEPVILANVPLKATLTGEPSDGTNSTSINVTVGGINIDKYEYTIDGGATIGPIATTTPISTSSLSISSHTLKVVGIDASGNKQSGSTDVTWTINAFPTAVTTGIPMQVVLNGEPSDGTYSTSINVTVSGNITSYKYNLNNAGYHATSTPIATPISASNLTVGVQQTLSVVGCDATGACQPTASSTNTSWTINTAPVSTSGGGGSSVGNSQVFVYRVYEDGSPVSDATTTVSKEVEKEVVEAAVPAVKVLTQREQQLNQIIDDAAKVFEGGDKFLNSIGVERNIDDEQKDYASYTSNLIQDVEELVQKDISKINDFIAYGAASTKSLGKGERAGILSSYKAAFGKLPTSKTEWEDAIKIGNGRWPQERSQEAEDNALASFREIYKRDPVKTYPNDDAAITILAYGLRPANRNLENEKVAIKSFESIYEYSPASANDWDAVRAIAYSGATREAPEVALSQEEPEIIVEQECAVNEEFTSDMKLDDVSDEIQNLQELLKCQGYFPDITTTQYFGPVTARSVREFKIANNVDSLGVVDAPTRELLNSNYIGVIRPEFIAGLEETCMLNRELNFDINPGDVSIEVQYLQEFLRCEGYFPASLEPTQYFGPVTVRGVRAFKIANRISSLGEVDESTRELLNSYVGVAISATREASEVIAIQEEVEPMVMSIAQEETSEQQEVAVTPEVALSQEEP